MEALLWMNITFLLWEEGEVKRQGVAEVQEDTLTNAARAREDLKIAPPPDGQ